MTATNAQLETAFSDFAEFLGGDNATRDETIAGKLAETEIILTDRFDTAQLAADAALGKPFWVGEAVSVACDDARIDTALERIGSWRIGPQGRVDITIPAGDFTFTAAQSLYLLDRRVGVRGAAPIVLDFVSLNGVLSSGSGNHEVTIEVADASQVAVGNILQITGATGTGAFGWLEGQVEVISRSGNEITYLSTARMASPSAYTLTDCTVVKMTTVLRFNGSAGITVRGQVGSGASGSNPYLGDIAIVGDGVGSLNGLILDIGTQLVCQGNVGVSGFGGDNIYGLYGSGIYAANLCTSGSGQSGIYFLNGGYIQMVNGAATGNGSNGVTAANSTVLAISGASLSGNTRGVEATQATGFGNNARLHDNTASGATTNTASLDLTGSTIRGSGAYGIRAERNSTVVFVNGEATGAVTADLYASSRSLILNNGATATTLSPAQNTVGNGNAVIANSNAITEALASLKVGDTGGTISFIRTATSVQDVASIAAGAFATFTVTVSGVLNNGRTLCQVTSNGAAMRGEIVIDAHVTATDTVTVFIRNVSAGAVDLPGVTYRIKAVTFV